MRAPPEGVMLPSATLWGVPMSQPDAAMSVPPPPGSGMPRYRRFAGPALFREGFRPFFLAAGLWAAAAMALWIGVLAGWIDLPTAFGLLDWHIHEMIFGFAGAAVAGFFL